MQHGRDQVIRARLGMAADLESWTGHGGTLPLRHLLRYRPCLQSDIGNFLLGETAVLDASRKAAGQARLYGSWDVPVSRMPARPGNLRLCRAGLARLRTFGHPDVCVLWKSQAGQARLYGSRGVAAFRV